MTLCRLLRSSARDACSLARDLFEALLFGSWRKQSSNLGTMLLASCQQQDVASCLLH